MSTESKLGSGSPRADRTIRPVARIRAFAATLLAVTLLISCGKQTEETTDDVQDSRSTLEEIARQALDQGEAGEAGQVQQMVEGAGYEVRSIGEYPSHWAGISGRMVIYADKNNKSGGAIYGALQGGEITPVWHWFFEDDAPTAVEPVELNDDGLWDVQMTMASGKTLTYIQDKDFSMMRPARGDWIALNGASSAPSSDDAPMWKCFDSDSSTAWRSAVSGGKKAFIVLPAPFGVTDGFLTVRTTGSGQPRHGTLYADGKKAQDFELEGKAASQMLQLQAEARGAHTLKLEFDSVYGGADYVAVAELGIK